MRSKIHFDFSMALVAGGVVIALATCASVSSMAETGASPRAPASSIAQSGEWGPRVNLRAERDAYRDHPQTMMRRQPSADGWWITPIHVNLLPKGDVLITGWARVQEKECDLHGGRQWPASFVLRINDGEKVPEGTRGASFYVNLIDEKPELSGGERPSDPVDVLYCSGHVPLSDGRVLFTGGARYTGLEFGNFNHLNKDQYEDEYGLDYSRIFDPRTGQFTRLPAPFPLGPSADEIMKIAAADPSSQQPNARNWAPATYKKGMMWYPTNTRLPGGRVLVSGGFARQSGPFDPKFPNRGLAIFDPASSAWIPWVAHKELLPDEHRPMDPTEVLNLGVFDYVHNFLLPQPVKVGGRDYHVALLGGEKGQYGLLSRRFRSRGPEDYRSTEWWRVRPVETSR